MANRRIKLFLLEDDEVDRMVFERFVRDEQLPYDYSAAGSVLEGKRILKSERFDVVVMDYCLPDGIAFDLIHEIQSDAPFIIFTGQGGEDIAVQAMKLGASDYLAKGPDNDYLKLLPLTVDNALKSKMTEKELKKYRRNLITMVEERTAQLIDANQKLNREVKGRKLVKERLQKLNDELEERIEERTAELSNANRELQAGIQEREVLLKEIHHRVKNNMQVISSLLFFQAQKTKDRRIAEIFKESRNRIQAMTLIHETLYASGNLARINLKEYIRRLADSMFKLHGTSPDQITIIFDAEDIALDIDQTVPCGLVINELISNSLKHAFPEDRRGVIKFEAHLEDQSDIELVVHDNGVGIPADVDIYKGETLGLNLVKGLVEGQLGGQLKISSAGGTRCAIRFSLDSPMTSA